MLGTFVKEEAVAHGIQSGLRFLSLTVGSIGLLVTGLLMPAEPPQQSENLFRRSTLDSTMIAAMSAIGGSIVGATGTFVGSLITQRYHDRRDLLANQIARREVLYSDFISESATHGRRPGDQRP